VNLLIGRIVLFGLLLLIAALSVVLPAQAFSKNPPPSKTACYEVVGRDLYGVNHDVYLNHKWSATNLSAAWVAAGWTGVLSTC
jgi:hypothetical protein